MSNIILDILGIKSNQGNKLKKVQNREMFELPDIKDISDLIIKKNGRYVILFRVSPVNGELLAEDTFESITDSIQGALSSFDGRIGIYIQSETIDIEMNLNNIEKKKQELNHEFKIHLLEKQQEHLRTMVNKSRNVLCFYVALEQKADNYAAAEQLLNDAYSSFKNELEAEEMYCDLLKEHDIKEMLYTRMNPEASMVEPYQQEWNLSNILPPNAAEYEDGRHVEIENRIYRFFAITNFPQQVDKYRWLRKIFNTKGDINVAIILNPKNKSTIQKELSKAVEEVGRKAIDDSQPEHIKQEYAAKSESAKDMIKELGSDNVVLYDTNITISISAKDMMELNTLSNTLRSKISSAYCQSTELKRKSFLPFFVTLPILADNKVTTNYVWNLSSKDIGSIIPFDSSEFMEESGTVIGDNVTSGGIVIANYQNKLYNNGHMCVIAQSGFGKTFFLMCDAIRNLPYYDYIILFDLKGDLIFPWGSRHTFSATSNLITNPFHIRNAIIDSESVIDNGVVNVGVYLQQKIMDLIVYFKWIIRNMEPFDEALLEEDIRDAYLDCDLDFKSTALPSIFCTFDTLDKIQKNKIANSTGMEKTRRTYINSCLKPFISGAYACMFNGQTNWDFDPFTVLALNEVPEAIMQPLYDLLLKDYWQFLKKDGTKNPPRKRGYIDELHVFADKDKPQTLKFVSQKLSKQSRGFGNDFVGLFQNLPDVLAIPQHGQAIIDNCYFKIFGMLGESDLPVAKTLYHFSDTEMKILKGSTSRKKSSKGKGIFIVGSQRVLIQVRASKYELEIIDPKQYEEIYGVPSRFINRNNKIEVY